MSMPVVQIRIVRMAVYERLVPVAVRVRFAFRIAGVVRMPMMSVVHVTMLVFEGLVLMQVLVPFHKV